MSQPWRARQMVPGKDNIDTMAMHYGLRSTEIEKIVMKAEAPLIREDGFKGTLTMVGTKVTLTGGQRSRRRLVLGWSDGATGVDPATTKLTRPAISAVARWKHENGSDN